MDIVKHPSDILRKIAEPILVIDDNIKNIANQMIEVMKRENGIGLACPQVGLSLQMFVIYIPEEMESPKVFINPKITPVFGKEEDEEGCLSIPGVKKLVKRNKTIFVKYKDLEGRDIARKFKGLMARCIQHENDHLLGILIIDK